MRRRDFADYIHSQYVLTVRSIITYALRCSEMDFDSRRSFVRESALFLERASMALRKMSLSDSPNHDEERR